VSTPLQIETGKRNLLKGRKSALANSQATRGKLAAAERIVSSFGTNITEWTRLSQLEVPSTATRAERRLAREALRTMIGCMTGKIAGAKARLRYTAAVRLREEIHGFALGSASHNVIQSDSSLTIELSPLLTPPSLSSAQMLARSAIKEQPKLDTGEPAALPED